TWGLAYNGQRITYSTQGGHELKFRVDGKEVSFGQGPGRWGVMREALPRTASGRVRHGIKSTWIADNIHFTQILEIVPGKPSGKVPPGYKRKLDTLLVRYLVENKGPKAHKVGVRYTIDMYIIDNDGALFASPTTHPGQVINGVAFEGKKLPPYIQGLQRSNVQAPGQVTHFTLKLGRLEAPSRFVCTNLGVCFGGW